METSTEKHPILKSIALALTPIIVQVIGLIAFSLFGVDVNSAEGITLNIRKRQIAMDVADSS
ncbi:hypothetical protein AGMMS49975_22780 [Clostridia bacterium]|nr:hypothetical protein AGMMS49975_22780 [Clostridia bacterium]